MPIDHSRPRVNLFPYQARGACKIWAKFEAGERSTLVVFATGTGKTVLGGDVARDVIEHHHGRVLWLAHRDLLCRQAVEDLAFCGVEASIEKAEEYARSNPLFEADPDCVVASVQSMQGRRLKSWPRDYFDLVIVDEAHHATGGSYKAILDHFRWKWLLGLTATPDRLDGENLGSVFSCVADEYSLPEAIVDGFLKRLRVVRVQTEVDLSSLSTRGKSDFSDEDLEVAMLPHIQSLTNLTKQYIENRRAFVFTPGVKSAEMFASGLQSLGIPAHSISGDTPNRDEIWDDFRQGRVRAVCNCDLATEGANFPFVSAVALARPTQSRAKLSQMIGRGTRKHPGQENCLAIDYAMLTGKLKLAKITDLFASGPTQLHSEAAAIAEEDIDSGEERDLMHAIGRAEAVRIERAKLRAEVEAQAVKHRAVIYDAFTGEDPDPDAAPKPVTPMTQRPRATEAQIAALAKFGIKIGAEFDRARASAILDKCVQRAKKGLSSKPQIDFLVRLGMPLKEARELSFEGASQEIDRRLRKHPA